MKKETEFTGVTLIDAVTILEEKQRQEQVIQNNKLIAEFMGAVLGNPSEKEEVYINVPDFWNINGSSSTWGVSMLQYHKRWDWLVPVVEKCFSLCDQYTSTQFDFDSIEDAFLDFDIKKTHETVVEFIKWYNENQ